MTRAFSFSLSPPRLPPAGWAAAASVAAGLDIALLPPVGLSPGEARAAGLVVATIGLWASGPIPESLTALIFFTVAMLGKVAPPAVVFSGFMSSAFWLILSGLILGAAIRQSGLGNRIAGHLADALGSTRLGALAGVAAFGVTMAFLMPSVMGRIVLMLPILTSLAERLGHAEGSRGRHALVLGGVLATALPSAAILPSNVPNNVLAGIVETTTGRPLGFGDYLLVNFPVLGLLKSVLLVAVIAWLHRDDLRKDGRPAAGQPVEPRPALSEAERRLSVLLGGALLLWATDWLHHISPAWIGMAAAVVCLFPPARLLPPKALQGLNLEPVFYVAGIISLGTLAGHAGLGQRLAGWILGLVDLAPGRSVTNFVHLCGLSTVMGLLTTVPGVPAVLTPLAGRFAAATGLSVDTVLSSQVVGFSTVLLPYQAPPLVVAVQTGAVPRSDMTRLCLTVAALSIVLLWPLHLLWLSVLGRL